MKHSMPAFATHDLYEPKTVLDVRIFLAIYRQAKSKLLLLAYSKSHSDNRPGLSIRVQAGSVVTNLDRFVDFVVGYVTIST